MAVKITELCIACDSCVEECPATAIVSASDSPVNGDVNYVKPERCIECSDGTAPKCADACPTEGAIVWDMPYSEEFNEYFVKGHESGVYAIREHKKSGIMFPSAFPKPYRASVSIADRQAHTPVK